MNLPLTGRAAAGRAEAEGRAFGFHAGEKESPRQLYRSHFVLLQAINPFRGSRIMAIIFFFFFFPVTFPFFNRNQSR